MYTEAEPDHCIGAKTLSKLIQIAIKEKELKRKSCVTSHILIPPLYVKMNYLNCCLVVTDDYSRFSWVSFLKTKDETIDSLMALFKRIENLYQRRIKRIRSDNGTEFKNSKMEEFCDERGILHEFSAPYTPQQNGVAERKNRTLIETARTMLADSKLPINFWAEAVSAACYTLNRVLTVKKFNKTCFELINNRKPNLKYLEPFVMCVGVYIFLMSI